MHVLLCVTLTFSMRLYMYACTTVCYTDLLNEVVYVCMYYCVLH